MKRCIKHRCICGLILALSMLATVAHADMQSARKALNANDYPAAIDALDKVIAQSPDNSEARFLKGLALARSGDTDGALAAFERLRKDEPEMAEAWNNLGVLRAREGNLEAARTALEKAVQLDPQHGPAQENLGDIYVALARNAYSRAGDLEHNNQSVKLKQQKLVSFLNTGAGQAETSKTRTASRSSSASNNASPPTVPNVTRGDNGQVAVDTSTPEASVRSWAKVWSAQDVGSYLSMYSDKFKPEDGSSRSAWARQRRDRVGNPESIDVSVRNLDVKRRGEQALAQFDQRYESASYQDRERKALLLTQTADGWQILREGKAGDVQFTAAAGNTASQSSSAQESRNTSSGNTSGSSETRGVRHALTQWAQAWSAQNLRDYLNAYSDNYQPAGGQSLASWIRERRRRVSAPARIDVTLSNIDISLNGNDKADATFDQHYKSNTYEDREHKRVTLVREDGGWRIQRER